MLDRCSVAALHRAAGVANPCDAQAVKLALKRMHRERGRAQVQAAPRPESAGDISAQPMAQPSPCDSCWDSIESE
jgi:hypothetical protein